MKNKHRIKQGLSLLLAGGIALTNLGAALPAFAEDAPATPETAEATTPETAEANVPTPNLSQITENLYADLPDAPTGSYLGSMGLPVATGETKIGISAWVSDLYDGVDAHMDADALNADENTVTIGKTPGTDYAIVPLLAQVEYPADGAVSEIILPDDVELLSYLSTDYEPIPADEQEQTEILHQTYSEQSAAATGLYVKASADFTAQLVYTDSDGSSQSKAIHVQISEDAAPTQMYADTGDDSIAVYAAGPTPPYATGKITSIAKEGGTWLIWFNGQEAYCCSHGLNGQPKGCPTYSFSHVSRLEPGQYTPGNHYANQVNIWGGLGQLSLDMLDDRPVVASLEDDPAGGEEQPDILGSLYDETQQWIMENYPDSYAAQTYIAAAEELINGTDAQSGENGYYTYIYNPPAGYAWQVVALVGEEIAGGTEIPDVPSVPEPKYYSAAWTAPAQSASGSFDLTFTVNTDNSLVKSSARGEYQLAEHDSFKINAKSSLWHWKSRDIGGKSALNYLIYVEGVPFVEAVRLLCEESPGYVPTPHEQVERKRPSFRLPPIAENCDRITRYLLGRHCTDRQTAYTKDACLCRCIA